MVGMSVGVLAVVLCLWVGVSCRSRLGSLGSSSLSISCVEVVVSGVGVCLGRLRVVDGGGWGVGVVRFLSSMRWDLRVVMAWAVVWRVRGGHGRVVSVCLIS